MLQWAEAYGVQKAEGFELTSDDGGYMYDVYARTVVDMPGRLRSGTDDPVQQQGRRGVAQ